MPDHIGWPVNKPDYRPGCHLIGGGAHNGHRIGSHITRIRGNAFIGIYRFHNIIGAVKRLVAYQLNLHGTVTELLNGKYRHILGDIAFKGRPDDNGMYISILVVLNHEVIYQIVAIEVEVIDPAVFAVQVAFKFFKGF